MTWHISWRADPIGRALADRHYSRRAVGAAQFVPTGGCAVLVTGCGRAVWVTSAQKAEFVRHAWPGAWVNSLFRNDGAGRSSELIRAAVAASLAILGPAPTLGLITFVDAEATKRRRSKRHRPGHCYEMAGFEHVGFTAGGLWAWRLPPDRMPPAELPIGGQRELEDIHAA